MTVNGPMLSPRERRDVKGAALNHSLSPRGFPVERFHGGPGTVTTGAREPVNVGRVVVFFRRGRPLDVTLTHVIGGGIVQSHPVSANTVGWTRRWLLQFACVIKLNFDV